MKKQVLSIEQMKNLKELGLDCSKASMCWIKNTDVSEEESMYSISVHDEWCYEMSCLQPVPTFTLQDCLELMPKVMEVSKLEISYLTISAYADGIYHIKYSGLCGFRNYNILDSAYEMLVWLLENKYIK